MENTLIVCNQLFSQRYQIQGRRVVCLIEFIYEKEGSIKEATKEDSE